ncbi:hypothetical protein [Candidatus Halobonum tyrrellensis]|nr:hypothetical protein [Candidatus Halobonum tyrrellensis]
MTDSMKDVSHTAPHETSADAVWERGNEKSDDAADESEPAVADD